MEVPQLCVICNQPIGALSKVTLGDKGCASINKVKKRHCALCTWTIGTPGMSCQYCKPDQIAKGLRVKEEQADMVTATNTGKHNAYVGQHRGN